jgi:hypothetical protein
MNKIIFIIFVAIIPVLCLKIYNKNGILNEISLEKSQYNKPSQLIDTCDVSINLEYKCGSFGEFYEPLFNDDAINFLYSLDEDENDNENLDLLQSLIDDGDLMINSYKLSLEDIKLLSEINLEELIRKL